MPDAQLNAPPPRPLPNGAGSPQGIDLADWLGGLLDTARDRGDAALARLIAHVVDDLGRAARS